MALDNPPAPDGAGPWWYWLASLGGAVVSLAHLRDQHWYERLFAVVAGTLTAGFCGPWLVEYLNAGPRGGAGIHFLLGLGGLMLTAGVVAVAKGFRDNPLATLVTLLQRVSGGKGG